MHLLSYVIMSSVYLFVHSIVHGVMHTLEENEIYVSIMDN